MLIQLYCVLTRVSGISGYHVQTVHSAQYSVYGRPHAHSRRTRAVSGHVQALRSMQSRLAAPRIHQVGCPSKADERATTAMSMLQRSTAAAQQARTAALLRRRTDHSHHADQPCAAGAWKTSLAAPRPTRCWVRGSNISTLSASLRRHHGQLRICCPSPSTFGALEMEQNLCRRGRAARKTRPRVCCRG